MNLFFIFLCVHVLLFNCSGIVVKVEPNDNILFIGNTNTLVGSTSPNGYVSIFKQEVNDAMGLNVSTYHLSSPLFDKNGLLAKLNSVLQSGLVINKAVLALGTEVFNSVSHFDDSILSSVRFDIESVVARLVQDNIDVILCPMAFQGEKFDGTNNMDALLEEYNQINRQISRDYNVTFVNLSAQMLKYWERNNLDNLPHSVLTIDGSVLNDRGHVFVALSLLRSVDVVKHGMAESNIVADEELRVRALRVEKERIVWYVREQKASLEPF
jgi:hypothetical protein